MSSRSGFGGSLPRSNRTAGVLFRGIGLAGSALRWLVIVALPFPTIAAGPTTPEDWQTLYNACLEGAKTVARDRQLSADFPAAFCGCVRESLRNTPEPERDAQFPAIRDRCSGKALSTAQPQEGYPPAGLTNLRKTCMQAKDIPAAAMNAYCDCYVDLVQKTVRWRDFLLLDSAIATKGLQALDAEEKAISLSG